MKKSLAYLLIFLFSVLMLLPLVGKSQATFTAPVGYNTGAPTATPSGVGTRWRIDLLTGKKYTWLPGTLSWDEDARGIDQVAGCSAPLYTPGYNQSTFAVNACSPPVLYQWTGAAWDCLNCTGYIAGTGIDITGGVITNTAPNIVQELSISGQDLTLSGGGGTVAIPGGVNIYNADGTVSENRAVTLNDKILTFSSNDGFLYGTQTISAGQMSMSQEFDDGEGGTFFNNFFQDANGFLLLRRNPSNENHQMTLNNDGLLIQSDAANWQGAKYDIEYPDILTDPRSIPDVGAVDLLKQTPVSYTNAAAPNNCIFYSTTVSKLCYKDPGGTVNPLY